MVEHVKQPCRHWGKCSAVQCRIEIFQHINTHCLPSGPSLVVLIDSFTFYITSPTLNKNNDWNIVLVLLTQCVFVFSSLSGMFRRKTKV